MGDVPIKVEFTAVGPDKVTWRRQTLVNRKERRVRDKFMVLQPLEVVQRGGAGKDGERQAGQMDGNGGGRAGECKAGEKCPRKEDRRAGAPESEPGPCTGEPLAQWAGCRWRHSAPEEGCGGGWGPGHPPLFADKQEQKHNQARDEGQADPDNGPRVVAGPCRGS